MARWYVVSYRHPQNPGVWIDYGEPVSQGDFDNVMSRLVKQCAPFTEVRIKILDVKEND
jgi:hypothetical protein